MRRFLRLVFFLVALPFLALAIAVIVLSFQPGWQKSLAERVLTRAVGPTTLESFRLSHNGVNMSGLRLSQGNDTFQADHLRVGWHLPSLFRRQLVLTAVELESASLDLARKGPWHYWAFEAESEPFWLIFVPFEGVFPVLEKSGMSLYLDGLATDLRITLPDGVVLQANLAGGGVSPGNEGQLDWRVDFAGLEIAEVFPDHAAGRLTLSQDSTGKWSAIGAEQKVYLRLPGGDPLALFSNLEVRRDPKGESYLVHASLPEWKTSLLEGNGRWDAENGSVASRLVVSLDPREWPAQVQFPEAWRSVHAKVHAQMDYSARQSLLSLEAEIEGQAREVGRWLASMAPLEAISLHSQIRIEREGPVWEISRLHSRLATPGETILEVNATQSLFLGETPAASLAMTPSGDWLRMQTSAIDLSWLNSLLEGIRLNGKVDPVSLTLRSTGSGLELVSGAVWKVEGFSLGDNENQPSQPMEITLRPRLRWERETWHIGLDNLRAGPANRSWLEGGLQAAATGLTPAPDAWNVEGNLRLDLQRLAAYQLPGFPGQIQRGLVQLELQGGLGASGGLNSRLDLRDLEIKGIKGRYGLTFTPLLRMGGSPADFQVQSGLQLRAPDMTSDGQLSANLRRLPQGDQLLEGTLSLNRLNAGQWYTLLTEATSETSSETPSPTQSTDTTDAVPWAGWQTNFTMRVEELVWGGQSAHGFSVRMETRPEILTFRSETREGPLFLNIDAQMTHQTKGRGPLIQTKGQVDIRGFDPSPLLGPGTGFLEGIFEVKGQFEGGGDTLPEAVSGIRGQFAMQGTSGVVRPLGKATSAVQLVSGLTGLLARDNARVQASQRIVASLSELPIERLSVQVRRLESLDLELSDFTIISREVRLRGQGVVRHHPSLSWANMPMDLRFDMGVRGDLRELMEQRNLLQSTTPDRDGFAAGPALPIQGTLGNPSSMLSTLIMESGAGDLLRDLFQRR